MHVATLLYSYPAMCVSTVVTTATWIISYTLQRACACLAVRMKGGNIKYFDSDGKNGRAGFNLYYSPSSLS